MCAIWKISSLLRRNGKSQYNLNYNVFDVSFYYFNLCQSCMVNKELLFHSVQFSPSVVSDSLRPHGLQPGLPVRHQLLEFTQTHVHRVNDAVQPCHPLLSPSPSAFNLPRHQGLFQGVSSSHQVAKVLEFQLQHQSFQWIFRNDFLWDGLVGSPCCASDSQESSSTP